MIKGNFLGNSCPALTGTENDKDNYAARGQDYMKRSL